MSSENIANVNTQAAEEQSNSMRWEDLDVKTISGEFGKLGRSLASLSEEMAKLTNAGANYDKTKEALETLRDKDLSPSGWLSSFVSENAGDFPGAGSAKQASKPDFYHVLLPDKRKKYDEVQDYIGDAAKLRAFFEPFAKILRGIPLANTFRIFAIIKNMAAKGWTTEEYHRINKDVDSLLELLHLGWGEIDRAAVLSARYYQEHISQMDSPKMKDKYIQLRQDDYNNFFQKYYIAKSFNYRGHGKFGVFCDRAASAKTLDAYMGKLVMHKDLGDRLRPVLAEAETLANSLAGKIELHTRAGISLHEEMTRAVAQVRTSLSRSLEEFTKFRNAVPEAPYCFMKCPEAADKAVGFFGFLPKWNDSWDKGTEYYEIYRKALYAVSIQCHEFVYTHGKVK